MSNDLQLSGAVVTWERWAAIFITDVVYGIHGEEAKVYVPTAVQAMDAAVHGATGAFYVDQIPVCE